MASVSLRFSEEPLILSWSDDGLPSKLKYDNHCDNCLSCQLVSCMWPDLLIVCLKHCYIYELTLSTFTLISLIRTAVCCHCSFLLNFTCCCWHYFSEWLTLHLLISPISSTFTSCVMFLYHLLPRDYENQSAIKILHQSFLLRFLFSFVYCLSLKLTMLIFI